MYLLVKEIITKMMVESPIRLKLTALDDYYNIGTYIRRQRRFRSSNSLHNVTIPL